MQRFSHKAPSVLEKKIFKGFYHGQWTATILAIFYFPAPGRLQMKFKQHWPSLQRRSHLKFSTFFPIQIHMDRANLTSPKTGQMSIYDHSLRKLGRPPVPNNLCKDSATRHPQFWRRRFLKVITIYGHGGHLGQWTAAVLATFHSPSPGRLQMKFEQHWPRGSKGGVV